MCTHRKYHYTCVIYGWDAACTASSAWITHMGVDKLEQQDKQPFYNVLVGDGSQRWATLPLREAFKEKCRLNIGFLSNASVL